jgi:hypothetical protein
MTPWPIHLLNDPIISAFARKTRAEDAMNKAAGTAQQLYGQTSDKPSTLGHPEAYFLSEKLQNVMAVTDVLPLFWQS